ncbi:MAG TPA: PepSY domain-containing protein [Urbifossiella sp.]|nr:PepSY domain-containing protein [Urbifossiella sp.]
MDLLTSTDTPPELTAVAVAPGRRPLHKRVMHVVRRVHLYLGLLLFPWAVLYGVTAFLFNHPAAFSEQPTTTFGPSATAGTPLDDAPTPGAVAEAVVAKLNEQQSPATPYRVAGEARYGPREFAFATVKADGQTVSVLYDVKSAGGTVRVTPPTAEKAESEKAPFATGSTKAGGRDKGGKGGMKGGSRGVPATASGEGVKLPDQLHDRLKAAVPTILARTGFPTGEVTVTSVPDVTFPIEADGRTWTASYNSQTGAVSGVPTGTAPAAELGWRRFLLRLHTTHGYPGEQNPKWFWAVVVDVMAGTMCFWGLSGLVMWWQLKGTRKLGAVVLLVSAAAATVLAIGMHAALTG